MRTFLGTAAAAFLLSAASLLSLAQGADEIGPLLTDLCTIQALKVADCDCSSSQTINLKSKLECKKEASRLRIPLEFSALQFPVWNSVNITEVYTALMEAEVDVCAKTVDVKVFGIASQYITTPIPTFQHSFYVGPDGYDTFGRDDVKQPEYIRNIPLEIPGTGIASDASEGWYPSGGLSPRSDQTFKLYLVPTVIDGYYSVQGFPDKTHSMGHVYHPRFELGLSLEAGFMDMESIGESTNGMNLPGYNQIGGSAVTFISQNQFLVELDRPISSASVSEGASSSGGVMDYYTAGISTSCPYDLGEASVKEVICPQGYDCGGASKAGAWASAGATAMSLLAGGALLLWG